MRRISLWLFVVLVIARAAHAQDAGHSFDSNGVEIHYTDRGEGEPVVLIHAMLETLDDWDHGDIVPALLEAGYRVVSFDVRGFGGSDKPTISERYGIEVVHDVARLLDHLGLDRAHVVGYSMGGQLAHGVRAVHPDRLLTVTLGGVGWGDNSGANMGLGQRLADALASYDGTNLDAVVRAGTPPNVPLTDEQVAGVSQMIRSTSDPAALAAFFRAGSFVSHTAESLGRNEVPALALVGERDPARSTTDALATVMPNLEVVEIPGATHGGARRDPLFAESLIAFLRKHPTE
jgi:pimeloyl-ACP methyl ester carboxylesterase